MPIDVMEFIEARIAEEEADAQAATPGPWWWDDEGQLRYADGYVLASVGYGGISCAETDEAHIARQNPAVTLPRCEMTRGLVGEFRGAAEWAEHPDCPDREREGYRRTAGTLRSALRYVAAFYRLRPDARRGLEPQLVPPSEFAIWAVRRAEEFLSGHRVERSGAFR